ncbi:MAG: hypothetical protein NTX38_18890, partial [Methylobacter sp.]|nr:hypothetical protein [Methylobacter sp.]
FLFKKQLLLTLESLNPLNFLNKIIFSSASSSGLGKNLLGSVFAILTGYLSRKLVQQSSRNPFLRLAGIFVQQGVTNFVANNSEAIKKLSLYFIKRILSYSSKENS